MRLALIIPEMLMFAALLVAQETRPIRLMPLPSTMKTQPGGDLIIQTSFSVGLHNSDPRLRKAAEIMTEKISAVSAEDRLVMRNNIKSKLQQLLAEGKTS